MPEVNPTNAIKLNDYVGNAKVEHGAIFNGLTVRVVGAETLYDYAALNPAAGKILDPDNLSGIKDNEILMNKDTDSVTKEDCNHELNEYRELTADPSKGYFTVHSALMKLAGDTDQNMSMPEATVMKIVEKVYRTVPVTIRKNADGQQEILITTPNFDRGSDRVFPEGGDLTNYNKNPVIMWIHDYKGATASAGLPVAKNSYLKVTKDGIIAGPPVFLEGDEFAMRVKNAWDKGFINTASIGFSPIESEPNDKGGTDYKKWEMLEWSFAPIPMNAEAARLAKSSGLEDLVEKPVAKQYTQAMLGDIIDELKCAVSNVGLSNDNKIELRRLAGTDTPVEYKAIIKSFSDALDTLEGHHKSHVKCYKDCKDALNQMVDLCNGGKMMPEQSLISKILGK